MLRPIALALALVALIVAPLLADDSGTWSNNSGSQSVEVSVQGGIHGDYKVTFKNGHGSTTVTATPDPAGGAGDVLESDEALILEYDDEGNVVGKMTYRVRNGRVEYKIGDQTTWRRMWKDEKRSSLLWGDDTIGVLPDPHDPPLLLKAGSSPSMVAQEFWSVAGDDTIGSLPDSDTVAGDL